MGRLKESLGLGPASHPTDVEAGARGGEEGPRTFDNPTYEGAGGGGAREALLFVARLGTTSYGHLRTALPSRARCLVGLLWVRTCLRHLFVSRLKT